MTIVPCISTSSIAARMASVATRSASWRSPRPMSRADAIAAASVTYAISRARSFSIAVPPGRWSVMWALASVPEVPSAGEDHRDVVSVGQLDRHLVADAATRLDDRGDPGHRGELHRVREGEVRVAGHDRELGPVAGAVERDLDRGQPVRLAGPD